MALTRHMAANQPSHKSRVTSSIVSLIFPGLGQIIRGRIFAGFLFFANVVLYLVPLFISHDMEYNIQNPSLLIALCCWLCSALDAFLLKSSFLVLALLVSLFCFGSGFFGAFYILPHMNI